jgi:hypothetical protein
MTKPRLLMALLSAVSLAACEKNAVQDISGPIPSARVRFFNFGLNAPSVNFYAGPAKLTATNSTTGAEATTGVGFGSVGVGTFGNYSAIAPNSYDLFGRIAATVDKDLAVITLNTLLIDGRFYSLYMSGPYNTTTKQSDGFVVEDNFPATINYGVTTVRFVNTIFNSTPMQLVAVNPTTQETILIGGPVGYKAGGAFVTFPGGVYDVFARAPGGTTNLISRTAVSFNAGRVYTISSRGDMTVVSTTLANRPFLDNTPNR